MAFELKKITTKESQYCIACGKEHKTGETVPMEFKKFGSRWANRIVCDGDCLAAFKAEYKSAHEKLLDRLSVQFN